jgi:acetyl esterase/lipase
LSAALLALCASFLFLSLWVVVPAPTPRALPFAILAAEASPGLLLLNAVGAGLCVRGARGSRLRRCALALGALGTGLAALPLAHFPAADRRFDAAMRRALGEDYASRVPPEALAAMRPRRLVLADIVRGLPAREARVTRGVRFASPAGEPLVMDITRPLARGVYPAIVEIYGGAWRSGTPAQAALFDRHMAAQGYVVFAIDYRHVPRFRFPAQLEDVRTALAFVREHAAEYEADASRVALLGRSAGGHLALLAAYEPGPLRVRGVVAYYPPIDLAEGYADPPRPDPIDVRSVLRAFLGGPPEAFPDLYRAASPIHHVRPGLPPTLVLQGSRDHLVIPRFARALDEKLRSAGNASVLLEVPWSEHAYDGVSGGLASQLTLYYVERFLAWVTAPV